MTDAHLIAQKNEINKQRTISQKRLMGKGGKEPRKETSAFEKQFGLAENYVNKLNREGIMKAKEGVNKQKLFMKVMSFKTTQTAHK